MEIYDELRLKPSDKADMMTSRSGPDPGDEDWAEAERPEVDGSDRQSDHVELLQIYMLTCLTVQRYEGETCAGQFHGEGLACFEGGHMYQGMFSKGLLDGRGVFIRADGLKYEGEFVSSLPMGQGTYTWPDGNTYDGEVCNCLRHGIGTYKSSKSSVVYTGQWALGKRHGTGAIYYNQEQTSWYKGDWVALIYHSYPSGNIYSGEWRNNLRHGEGTMRWMSLRQQYVGTWQDGVQHGQGTHFWNISQGDGLHFFLNSHYTGEFVQGQRHGRGRVCFASGASYDGEWDNDQCHSQGTFRSADGRIFEGDLVYEQIMAQCVNSSRELSPLSDMTLSIERLLATIPAGQRGAEYEQVAFAVLKHGAELRSIYRFYSRLGRAQAPYSLFQLTRLQLWRLLKDCHIHHHFPLSQTDQFMRGEATMTDVHSPFTPILLRQLLSSLVVVAYHIYHQDVVSEMSLLADCFTKLMKENILPNACCVKGFLFRQPDYTAVAVNHIQKCCEIYKSYCKSSPTTNGDQTMTCRDLLWMFEGLNLLDSHLTTARLMGIITSERLHPSNLTCCLDEEITFLEFFEVLFGCAEVFLKASEGPDGLPPSSSDTQMRGNCPTHTQQAQIPGDETNLLTGQDQQSKEGPTTVTGGPQTAEHFRSPPQPTEKHGLDKQRVKAKDQVRQRKKDTKDKIIGCEEPRKIGTVNDFFDQLLFPAFERKCQPQNVTLRHLS